MAFDSSDSSDDGFMSMSLHDMFRIIGDQMTARDLKVLKYISSAFISPEMLSNITNGFDFFLCMETMNRVTETNFRHVLDLLQIISRQDLSHLVNLRTRNPVLPDPVCEYLETGASGPRSSAVISTPVCDGSKSSTATKIHICDKTPKNEPHASSSHTDLTSQSDVINTPGASSCVSDSSYGQITVAENGPCTRTRSKSRLNKSYMSTCKRKHTLDTSVQLQDCDKRPKKLQRISASSSQVSREPCDHEDNNIADVNTDSYDQKEDDKDIIKDNEQDENVLVDESKEPVKNDDTEYQTLSNSTSRESPAIGDISSRPDINCDNVYDANVPCDISVDSCDKESEIDDEVNRCTDPRADCEDPLSDGSSDIKNNHTDSNENNLEQNTKIPSVSTATDDEVSFAEESSSTLNGKSASSLDSARVQHDVSESGPSKVQYVDHMSESRVKYIDPSSESRVQCVDSMSGSTSRNEHSTSMTPGTSRSQQDGSTSMSGALRVQSSDSAETNEQLHSKIRKQRYTCDIRLRVRAEYCQHSNALEGNVFSNKPTVLERQFEKFTQANTILKSRDLGAIVCDIKFSELTYLDAFWRDYINGSLLEALKGIFLTDSLKQAVGHEAIKLLVNVDEDDYESGRLKLLKNLTD